MANALTLWTHALAALLFAALAVWAVRQRSGAPRLPLAIALGITALWALAVAGIGGHELITHIAESLRNFAWIAFLFTLHRHDATLRPPVALVSVYAVVALLIAATVMLNVAAAAPGAVGMAFATSALLFRLLVTVAALLLLQALHRALGPGPGMGPRWIVGALAAMWLTDFVTFSLTLLLGTWQPDLVVARGVAMVGVAIAIAAGLQRREDSVMHVSRTVAYQSLALVAVGAYLALLAVATSVLDTVGGENARVLQTAFVFGTAATMLAIGSSPWLRAWTKVKLAKHFYRHRYDYRAEWIRFTETLGRPDEAAPLDMRIVKAMCDLMDAPAGLLLVPEEEGLGIGAAWNWPEIPDAGASASASLMLYLNRTGRVLELDAIRDGHAIPADVQAVPQWMAARETAWVLVPLPHFGRLAGAIVLARPPVPRALDWEDFDLLKVAGRQAASYLAEARAQDALAEAQRFDEFNRRFAFIVHDIKNLVSQLTLVARNAERHADNPAFRADMIATLGDSVDRMNALLARLSQHNRSRAEPPLAMDVRPLIDRMARNRARQHPVEVVGAQTAYVLCDPARLEQLLGHLVQNAVEASPPGAPVTITLGHNAEGVTIDVIDRGCGMSPAFVRDRLFKPFVSSKPGGFGIGAFEARALATALGGRIDVTSREGEGSCFRVTLKPASGHPSHVEEAA